jgi:uncharacterized membrane protein YtjA (UPF0391 family)
LTGVIPPPGSSAPAAKPILFRLICIFADFCPRNQPEPSLQFRIIFVTERAALVRADLENGIEHRGGVMLSWVVTFLIIALIAGILGFGGIAGASMEIAKIIFFIAVVLFLVSAVVGLARGRTRV